MPTPKPTTPAKPDAIQKLYPSTSTPGAVLERHATALLTKLQEGPTELAAREARYLPVMLALGGRDGEALVEADILADFAGAHLAAEVEPAVLQQHRENVIEQIAGTYGPSEALGLLERARKFVKSQPEIAAILNKRDLGDRPDLVMPIVAHVRRVGYFG